MWLKNNSRDADAVTPPSKAGETKSATLGPIGGGGNIQRPGLRVHQQKLHLKSPEHNRVNIYKYTVMIIEEIDYPNQQLLPIKSGEINFMTFIEIRIRLWISIHLEHESSHGHNTDKTTVGDVRAVCTRVPDRHGGRNDGGGGRADRG